MSAQRNLGIAALAIAAMGCAAMHKEQISQMRANGDPRADCYEACGASDMGCMKTCDNKHPFAGTILQGVGTGGAGAGSAPANANANAAEGAAPGEDAPAGGIDSAAAMKLLTEAAKIDEARRRAAAGGGSSPSTSSGTSTSTGTGTSTSTTRTPAPRSEMDCNPPCGAGQRCLTYLAGSKQCAPGGKCWTVDKTHGECK